MSTTALDAILAESRQLKAQMVTAARAVFDSGEGLPVFKTERLLYVVHPSTKQPGQLQVTTYNDTGALGDMHIRHLEDLPNVISIRAEILPATEAAERLQLAALAEMKYQEHRHGID